MLQSELFGEQSRDYATSGSPIFLNSRFQNGRFESKVSKQLRHCQQFRRVRVYRNLNKPEFFSIIAMEGSLKGKVCGYAKSVLLENFTFIVSEASRQRVLREQQRNVHAYCDGVIIDASDSLQSVDKNRYVTYNPYLSGFFYYAKDNTSIRKGSYHGVLQSGGVYLLGN